MLFRSAMPAEAPIPQISLIGTIYWFAYFLVILPLLGLFEEPTQQPLTIEEDFDAKHPATSAEAGTVPAE